MDDLHQVQMHILRELLFHPGSRFTDLNKPGLTSDHFTYHLTRLLGVGLVTKDGDRYLLTASGKESANRMDTDEVKMQKQAKIGVLMCGERDVGEEKEYLIQKRLKEPFYGYQGFPSGKVKYGEGVLAAAKREFREETGLDGKPKLFSIFHYLNFSPDGKILEDKFFTPSKLVGSKANSKKNTRKEKIDGSLTTKLLPLVNPSLVFWVCLSASTPGSSVFKK